MKQKQKLILLAVAFSVWLVATGAGLAALLNYANAPGRQGVAPLRLSQTDVSVQDAEQMTLVMFAHPRCPCTRASVGELARLMARAEGKLEAEVFFYLPEDAGTAWAMTDLWRSAEAIPGVTAKFDRDGRMAREFHAETSGQVMLYDTSGNLRFSGGITSARGHFGDNFGTSSLLAILQGTAPECSETPVFGCALQATR